MPEIGLKPSLSKKDVKRRSTLDPFSFTRRHDTSPETGNTVERPPIRRAVSQDARRPKSSNDTEPQSIAEDPPGSPPVQGSTAGTKRFSMMRFRHASDSQLNTKAREQAADPAPPVPPVPPPPAIITTSPTMVEHTETLRPPKRRMLLSAFQKRPVSYDPGTMESSRPRKSTELLRNGLFGLRVGSSASVNEQDKAPSPLNPNPPAISGNGSLGTSSLAPPQPRLSESSRSDASSGEHITFANQQKPQKTPKSKGTSRFRVRSSKKDKPLFPLPVRIPQPQELPDTAPNTPRASTSGISAGSPVHSPGDESPPTTALHKPISGNAKHTNGLGDPFQSPSRISASATSLGRQGSTNSKRSARSSPVRAGLRERSNTMGSLGGRSDDTPTPPHFHTASGRNSTSTAGRSSFSNLFGLSGRFRHNSEPHSPRHSSPAHGHSGASGFDSHTNSLNISRETLPLPEREEGEPPGKYLERIEQVFRRSKIAALMCKKDEAFSLQVLRSFMRKFLFFGDPIDMAVRKLLMEVELPAETQQIDRFLQGFADRYHECNPGIFTNPEKANYIAFSIMILHTDFFNKNNKRKMQKQDYVKNSSCEGVSEDVLGCIYDNTVYTPFIHVEDDHELKDAAARRGAKKSIFKPQKNDPARKAIKEPVDPYVLIFENKLEALRPHVKDEMNLEDPYSYYPQGLSLEVKNLHNMFVRYGVLQVVSMRSRPEAFMNVINAEMVELPDETQMGFVDIPVTKVGVLWRKDTKRKAARSPWQEWGAILTRSGLSIFKNAAWTKNLMNQHENHVKQGHSGAPVVFKPALQDFKPDHLVPLDGTVALLDSSYKKHKNAFIVATKNGNEETFLADSDAELQEWLGVLNYSAAFETFAVRPRGLIGGSYEGQRNRGIRRLDSSHSTKTVQTATGEVTIQSGKIDQQYAQQLAAARREHVHAKIEASEEKLTLAIKQLDSQLRDARHLLIMAPVQPRTREHVVQAAGVLAAKIKWTRTDIWRLKCHRDMLAMDLEDEKKRDTERQARVDQIAGKAEPSPSKPKRVSLAKLNSKASQLLGNQKSPHSPTSSHRPGTKSLKDREVKEARDTREPGEIIDDVFKTPTELSKQNSPGGPPGQWELPPISFSPASGARRSSHASGSAQSPKISSLNRRDSMSSMGERLTAESMSDVASQYQTPPNELEEEEPTAKQTPSNVDGRADATSESEPERTPLPGSPSSNRKSKVRRSLQRTLRETHDGSRQRRSHKGKESTSTIGDDAPTASATETEGLTRARGSFTVHGKKASVITFGNEWQASTTTAEERLKERRLEEEAKESAARQNGDETSTHKSGSIRSGKQGSLHSVSTATAPSMFRDRLNAVNAVATDDEDAKLRPSPSLREGRRSRRPSRASSTGMATEPSIKEKIEREEVAVDATEEDEEDEEEINEKGASSEELIKDAEEIDEKEEVKSVNGGKLAESEKPNGLHAPKEQSVEA